MANDFIYQQLCETVTPIFDQERGRRLKFMRMALLMDQTELGKRLGIPQQAVTKLELGQIKVARSPVPLSKFYLIFGCATHHILFGLDAEKFNYETIRELYWREKDRTKGDRTSVRLPRSVRVRSISYRRAWAYKHRRT